MNDDLISGVDTRHCGNCFYGKTPADVCTDKCVDNDHWSWEYDPGLDTNNETKRQQRPSWDVYFMNLTPYIATRSTCIRRQVGALIVKDKQIVSTGYNGAPRGVRHCYETGCLRQELGIPSGERHELCRSIHAEANALMQAARNGVSTNGAYIYCTDEPCSLCMKMMINAGIRRIFYTHAYPDKLSKSLAKETGIEVIQMKVGG